MGVLGRSEGKNEANIVTAVLVKFESAVCQLEASIEAGQKVHRSHNCHCCVAPQVRGTLKPLLSLRCCLTLEALSVSWRPALRPVKRYTEASSDPLRV